MRGFNGLVGKAGQHRHLPERPLEKDAGRGGAERTPAGQPLPLVTPGSGKVAEKQEVSLKVFLFLFLSFFFKSRFLK